MADNVDVTPGIGVTIAADEVGGAKWQRVKLGIGADGTAVDMGTPADALSGGATLPAGGMVFNGSTWDRQRGNLEGTLLASAARTATTGSAQQTNYNHRGVVLYLNVTAAGTGTVAIQLNGLVGFEYTIAVSSTLSGTGGKIMSVYPGVLDADVGEDGKAGVLPRSWFGYVSKSDGSSWTFSLSYSLIV